MKKDEEKNRFAFGKNWKHFLTLLDDDRIFEAETSLREMLGIENLKQKSFLDIGSGSGLFSLAARRLGARVHSFDYDGESVSCTNELKTRFFPDDSGWTVEQGSILDQSFVENLDQFDIVYSWGVLHHTGAMWLGIENAISRVSPNGTLYIAIYNDQGWKSHVWWFIKFIYNKLPTPLNIIYGYSFDAIVKMIVLFKYALKGKARVVLSDWFNYKNKRGMSLRYDALDWFGGFPFEYASYETLRKYMEARGFELFKGIRVTTAGCHRIVFNRIR